MVGWKRTPFAMMLLGLVLGVVAIANTGRGGQNIKDAYCHNPDCATLTWFDPPSDANGTPLTGVTCSITSFTQILCVKTTNQSCMSSGVDNTGCFGTYQDPMGVYQCYQRTNKCTLGGGP